MAPGIDDVAIDDAERARRIRIAIRARGAQLRGKYTRLRYQDAIGASVLAVSVLGTVGAAVAYGMGALAWWIAVPLAAVSLSLAHEIEHDQIHQLYFRSNTGAQNIVLAVCWVLRPYTISPWTRKPLHLLHHRVSGTEQDIEERVISNGEKWGLRRVLMMIDPLVSVVLRLPREPVRRRTVLRQMAKAYFPMTYVALLVWYSFIGFHAVDMVTGGSPITSGVPLTVFHTIDLMAIVWIAPNVLRVTCLHFISSNMHYYGDIEKGNVVQQTQVLNRWYLIPAQLFCVNFGSTHAIHHFVPNEPFYVRQLTARAAHRAMRDNGVRFNDLGSFRRANRYHSR